MQLASFEDSMALLDSLLKEMVGVPLEGFDMKELANYDVSKLKDILFKVISSKAVKDALWVCMASCIYQAPGVGIGNRIQKDTFESENARGDFFPVAGEVAAFNLAPFFKNLKLPSSIQAKLTGLDVSQKSATG